MSISLVRRIAVLSLLIGSAVPVGLARGAATSDVVIGLIDTGVNLQHQEFSPDQLVGWWDFARDSGTHLPAPGQTFDPAVAPNDPVGHGTATASMAVGRNVSAAKTPSLAPGYHFAMANVFTAGGATGGTLTGSVGEAIRWEVDTIGAKVISISIGTLAPIPLAATLDDTYRAIDYARSQGVLVVVANGNGLADTGVVPSTGAFSSYAESTHVLAVGAAGAGAYLTSYQPEVVSDYQVTAASNTDNTGYVAEVGTSFATPRVAGFAARLLGEAAANGRTLSADALEVLVKYSATPDNLYPAVVYGYGAIGSAELPAALVHAANGTLFTRPSPDYAAIYVEQVAGTERSLNQPAA